MLKGFIKDSSISAWIAGLIATVISFAGPLVIIIQAATAGGLSPAEISSWVGFTAIGSGVLGIVLSLMFKAPIVIAWSIPGSALLVTALPQVGLSHAIGAYIVSGVLVFLIGVTGLFDRLLAAIPGSIAAGLQAGILFSFGIAIFTQMADVPLLVLPMLFSYVLLRRYWPRYAIAGVLLVGVAVALSQGQIDTQMIHFEFMMPQWTTPTFSLIGTLSLAIPLALVSLTGQFMPGMSILRNSGFNIAARPILVACGAVSVVAAPLGVHGFNMAAVTLALCASSEAHEDPDRRYVAAVAGSILYLLLGIAGTTLVILFSVLPAYLIAALAGLALCGALIEGLRRTMSESKDREAGFFCFLITASGIELGGLSAPFWGVIIGLLIHIILSGNLLKFRLNDK